jgi:hypothetical protein
LFDLSRGESKRERESFLANLAKHLLLSRYLLLPVGLPYSFDLPRPPILSYVFTVGISCSALLIATGSTLGVPEPNGMKSNECISKLEKQRKLEKKPDKVKGLILDCIKEELCSCNNGNV